VSRRKVAATTRPPRVRRVNSYVDFRMNQWGMAAQSGRVQRAVRKVLGELSGEGLLCLKDKRFEVMVHPDAVFSVWAISLSIGGAG
jgi:hypothetical protein